MGSNILVYYPYREAGVRRAEHTVGVPMLAPGMASNVMSSWRPPFHCLTLSNSGRMGSSSTYFTSTRIGFGQSIYHHKPIKPLIVMMGRREQSLQEIREKSTEDINEEIIDLKGEIQMFRFLKSSKQEEYKASDCRKVKKKVAWLLTVRRERELEQGINKKQSRKMNREWKRSVPVRPPPSLRKMQEESAKEKKGS